MAIVVIGAQWGDEGKGKLVDILCDTIDVCARCQGGNNAGHTIVADGTEYDFHILPSGLVNPKCLNIIGSGVVVHVPSFFKELEELEKKGLVTDGRIFISDRAHIVFDLHQMVDGLEEVQLGAQNIGTTRKGIGPCYSTKASRSGVRMAEVFSEELFEKKLRKLARSYERQFEGLLKYDVELEIEQFKTYRAKLAPFVIDIIPLMTSIYASNKKILVEGANAIMLDLDYGTYPYVTSSNTGIGGVFTGLGLSPFKVEAIVGVVKAYTTRVGGGPMPSEQLNGIGEKLQQVGREIGVTTGRKRRCGWLDLVVVKYSAAVNHYTSLNLTKLDVLDSFPELQVATEYSVDGKPLESFPADLSILGRVSVSYKILPGWQTSTTSAKSYCDLPKNAQMYIEFIERFVGIKVKYIGIGPGRQNMIMQ